MRPEDQAYRSAPETILRCSAPKIKHVAPTWSRMCCTRAEQTQCPKDKNTAAHNQKTCGFPKTNVSTWTRTLAAKYRGRFPTNWNDNGTPLVGEKMPGLPERGTQEPWLWISGGTGGWDGVGHRKGVRETPDKRRGGGGLKPCNDGWKYVKVMGQDTSKKIKILHVLHRISRKKLSAPLLPAYLQRHWWWWKWCPTWCNGNKIS